MARAMKKNIRTFLFVALAATIAAACSREEPAPRASVTHRVTIHALQGDTKTLIEEGISSAAFRWSADDADRFSLKENATAGSDISIDSSDGYETITLAATFETVAAAEYTYSAVLAKKMSGGNPQIPVRQTSTGSAYDPDADILVARPETFATPQDELSLQFARPAVINKMTLKGLTAGETISRVLVSADNQIAGSYSVSGNSWTGTSSEIEIHTSQTVPASGQITVYFVSMPVSGATLTVRAISVNTIYSKTFSRTIDLVRDQVTVFGVSGLTATPKPDYSGTYVMTNASGTRMAKPWGSGENNIKSIETEQDGGVVYYDPDAVDINAAKMTFARVADGEYAGMYTILQNSKYLYASAPSNNNIRGTESLSADCYWDVLLLDGEWTAVARASANRNVLQFNEGNSLFSCYSTDSQSAFALFDASSAAKPSPAIAADHINRSSSAAAGVNTGATFNSNTSSVSAAAYADEGLSTPCDWLSVAVAGTTVNYTVTENSTGADRIGYIRITATNAESHSVSKVIRLTQSAGISYTLTFTSITESCNDYTSTWTQTCGGHSWTMTYFNNYNKGWEASGYVRCGRKDVASAATITTSIPEAIAKVTLNISAITAAKVNSITLYVDTSAGFDSGNLQTVNASVASGIQNLLVPVPRENCHYKLVFDCAGGTSNGLVTLLSVVYTAENSGSATSYLPGGWLELPSYSTSAMSPTTTSTLTDLHLLKHFAMMGGDMARNYTCLYDPEMYASYWVAYPLCADHLGTGRDESWAYDPDVLASKQTNLTSGAYGVSLSTENYPSNLYSRGHQLPNADRNGVAAMMAQTYYMTNLTPQIQNGFNSPVWSGLEDAVRGFTTGCDTVYVVTGAAFRKATDGTESITYITNKRDSKSLPVPNYYWKALLKVTWTAGEVSAASAIGVWMPHADLKGETYASYVVSVDQLEAWTGFNLFANLPEALQTAAESNTSWSSFSSF